MKTKDWKAIAEKQAEIIRHFDNKCPSMGWYEKKRNFIPNSPHLNRRKWRE